MSVHGLKEWDDDEALIYNADGKYGTGHRHKITVKKQKRLKKQNDKFKILTTLYLNHRNFISAMSTLLCFLLQVAPHVFFIAILSVPLCNITNHQRE